VIISHYHVSPKLLFSESLFYVLIAFLAFYRYLKVLVMERKKDKISLKWLL
jgi:hypothetical protein